MQLIVLLEFVKISDRQMEMTLGNPQAASYKKAGQLVQEYMSYSVSKIE
jgi:hypothetical protein